VFTRRVEEIDTNGKIRLDFVKQTCYIVIMESGNQNKEADMTKYYNTNERYGEAGPFEAQSRERLADEMTDTFRKWAREFAIGSRIEDPTADVDEMAEMLRMRSEFIEGLEER
jgi:hypothetical protein